jgi:hypothetical protein
VNPALLSGGGMTALSDRLSVAVRTAPGSAGDWITASFAGMTVLGGVCSVLPADLRTACGPRAGYRNTSRSGGQTRAGVALPRRSSSGQGDSGCADAVSPIITRNVPAADHGSVISAVDARRAEK